MLCPLTTHNEGSDTPRLSPLTTHNEGSDTPHRRVPVEAAIDELARINERRYDVCHSVYIPFHHLDVEKLRDDLYNNTEQYVIGTSITRY